MASCGVVEIPSRYTSAMVSLNTFLFWLLWGTFLQRLGYLTVNCTMYKFASHIRYSSSPSPLISRASTELKGDHEHATLHIIMRDRK